MHVRTHNRRGTRVPLETILLGGVSSPCSTCSVPMVRIDHIWLRFSWFSNHQNRSFIIVLCWRKNWMRSQELTWAGNNLTLAPPGLNTWACSTGCHAASMPAGPSPLTGWSSSVCPHVQYMLCYLKAASNRGGGLSWMERMSHDWSLASLEPTLFLPVATDKIFPWVCCHWSVMLDEWI